MASAHRLSLDPAILSRRLADAPKRLIHARTQRQKVLHDRLYSGKTNPHQHTAVASETRKRPFNDVHKRGQVSDNQKQQQIQDGRMEDQSHDTNRRLFHQSRHLQRNESGQRSPHHARHV